MHGYAFHNPAGGFIDGELWTAGTDETYRVAERVDARHGPLLALAGELAEAMLKWEDEGRTGTAEEVWAQIVRFNRRLRPLVAHAEAGL